MRISLVVSIIFALCSVSKGALCLDISPTGSAADEAIAQTLIFDPPVLDKEYKRNRLMQTMGYSLLGASAAMIITGAAMIEAAPWGPRSRAGIIFVSTGMVHFIASAFLLGFSKTILRQELPPVRPVRVIRKTSFLDVFKGGTPFSGTEQGLF
jgi:hypothetical protein